jgi:hypothetical protein
MIFPVKIAWRARFPAGGLASNILPKELPVFSSSFSLFARPQRVDAVEKVGDQR